MPSTGPSSKGAQVGAQVPLGQLLDPETGEVLDAQGLLNEVHALRKEVTNLREELKLSEKDLRSKRAQISRLKNEQHERFKQDGRYQDACDVLNYWHEMLMPSAKEPLTPDRVAPTLARLKGGYSVEELKACIRGYYRLPYVVDPGRRSATGKATQRRVEPDLIFRNPAKVQYGIDIAAEKADEQQLFSQPEPVVELPLNGSGGKASLYAQRYGWHIFPCRPGLKTPATRHGLLDATDDPGRISAYWDKVPDANVAIRTGAESGLVVLDVDPRGGGDDSLSDLEHEHGELPETLTVSTPSGGTHFYFQHPAYEVKNTQGVPGAGLDIRGDGGYVLAPPSMVDGKPYEFEQRTSPAPMPEWLGKAIVETQRQYKDVKYWLDLTAGVKEGQRNSTMAQIVGKMLGANLDLALVGTLALAVNGRFKPPMPEKEVMSVVESINRRHTS